MKTLQKIRTTMVVAILLLFSGSIWATNIQITKGPEIVRKEIAQNKITVRFSVSWDNSWNLISPPNHDAAWIFMKYRTLGRHGFQHCYLHTTDEAVVKTMAGSTRYVQEYGESPRPYQHDAAVGIFLNRIEKSVGTTTFNDIELEWDISGTGITAETVLSVRVYAIEMVYIPIGAFYSNNTIYETGAPTTMPAGSALHQVWPLGTNPFYIMKHEVTQAAWVDFLNTLDYEQQLRLSHVDPRSAANTSFATGTLANSRMMIRVRVPSIGNAPAVYGCNVTVSGDWNHENQGGNIPMFGLAWTDITAYLDWAGLRPITELEYEKACRGELPVVANEFAWGNANFLGSIGFNDQNRPNEVSGTTGANIAIPHTPNEATAMTAQVAGVSGKWPIRAGAFARENTTRHEAGASYWGVLNLSDNVPERLITYEHTDGRGFDGTHGDGNLLGTGLSNVQSWPAQDATLQVPWLPVPGVNSTTANGQGYRGISLTNTNNIPAWTAANFGVSTRLANAINNPNNIRDPWTGFRGGRSITVEFSVMAHPSLAKIGNAVAAKRANSTATGANFQILRVSGVGGELPYKFQWYWADSPEGNQPSSANLIEGATTDAYTPPNDVAHTERYFFCVITEQDGEGESVITNTSGAHTVLGVGTNPNLVNVNTNLTVGTALLTVAPTGGAAPYRYQWLYNTAANSTGGTPIVGAENYTYHPIIPYGSTNFYFYCVITDNEGATVRTDISGVHYATPINYTSATQTSVPLPIGIYRFEVWGASGGLGFTTAAVASTSGFGGFAAGNYKVTEAHSINVVVGGAGTNSSGTTVGASINGGHNGGGLGGSAAGSRGGGGGGGATHISLNPGLLSVQTARDGILLVAGGGGGGAWTASNTYIGGAGGGASGTASLTTAGVSTTNISLATGGTATAGGTAGQAGNVAVNRTALPGTPGAGGRGIIHSAGQSGGGGGGGWYGGGGGGRITNTNNTNPSGGAGGSGYLGTANGLVGSLTTGMYGTYNTVGGANQTGAANATNPQSPQGAAGINAVRNGAARIYRFQ